MALCIPNYGWVPGLSGPPDWFSPAAAGGNTSLTDPRWVSALRLGIEAATGEEKFTVRTVQDSATNRLFLSAWVRYDRSDAFENTDQVWIGFNPAAPGTPRVLTFTYDETTAAEAANDVIATLYSWNSGTSPWTNVGSAPGWATNIRVWRRINGSRTEWAFQMVIDLATAGLGTTFGMCFQARAVDPFMTIPYRYPLTMPIIAETLTESGLNPTEGTHWQAFTFAGAGAACDPGVWIDPSRIGTTNRPTHKINLNASNTFQAMPHNDSSEPVNIRARFRLANWGSTPEGAWRDLLVTPAANVGPTSDGLLQAGWQPDAGNVVQLPTPPGGTQDEVTFYSNRRHQCMMVVLEAASGTVYFSRDSCVRNMDFDEASRFSRTAEISVRGLDDGYPRAQRDVYVSVERINVPTKIDDETRRKYQQVQEVYRGVSDISEGFSEVQRYVAILEGDLRHLRYIDMAAMIEWAHASFFEEQLVGRDSLLALLERLGIEGTRLIDLIDRYANEAIYYHEQLSYDEKGQPILDPLVREIIDQLLESVYYRGDVSLPTPQIPPVAELEQFIPTVRYHVFRDTGLRTTVNGVVQPIVEPQASFGYYLWLDHEVERWELRLQGAQKLAENLYLLRPPTNGAMDVTTVIHAVEPGDDTPIDPPEPIIEPPIYKPDIRDEEPTRIQWSNLELLALIFERLGTAGKGIAQFLRSVVAGDR